MPLVAADLANATAQIVSKLLDVISRGENKDPAWRHRAQLFRLITEVRVYPECKKGAPPDGRFHIHLADGVERDLDVDGGLTE
jgi:hypothetical protein